MSALLSVRDLSVDFTTYGQTSQVLHGVSLDVPAHAQIALVGESGSGKTVTMKAIMGLLRQPPAHIRSGQIFYDGRDLLTLADSERLALRGTAMSMVFQDPMSSLNPRMRIADIIGEAPLFHGIVPKSQLAAYVADLMERVGLDPSFADRFPHQFSGGQRTRVGIARALAVKPRVIVADEAVASLDVSIQAQIINLFMQLRAEFGLAYLFISHDLGVVRHLADRVAILYLGRVVEIAPADELFQNPGHPYTQALLANMPKLETGKHAFAPLQGEIPSPLNPPTGCHFHPRCPFAMERCTTAVPVLQETARGRRSACHLNDHP